MTQFHVVDPGCWGSAIILFLEYIVSCTYNTLTVSPAGGKIPPPKRYISTLYG